MNKVLHAPNISCDHCAMAIKRELAPISGVISVDVDVDNKDVQLDLSDESTLAKVEAALEDIGYPIEAS